MPAPASATSGARKTKAQFQRGVCTVPLVDLNRARGQEVNLPSIVLYVANSYLVVQAFLGISLVIKYLSVQRPEDTLRDLRQAATDLDDTHQGSSQPEAREIAPLSRPSPTSTPKNPS